MSDVGVLRDGTHYMVMEYLSGMDLGAWLRCKGPVSPQRAADFVLQACEGLAEAHDLGIVHRDLKPSNLFACACEGDDALIKVLDFGVSKSLNPSLVDSARTDTHVVMGSPLYMSPEQMASSRDVDQRTDVWALGAILFELVTGRPPFVAQTFPQLCLLVKQQTSPRVSSLCEVGMAPPPARRMPRQRPVSASARAHGACCGGSCRWSPWLRSPGTSRIARARRRRPSTSCDRGHRRGRA